MKIVDCFRFFAPYNEELAYLRIELLKDYVDNFIVVESNKNHVGVPVKREFLEIAKKYNFPMDKIIYVEHDMPEREDIEIVDVDILNAGDLIGNSGTLLARARERLQLEAMNDSIINSGFDDEDVFLLSDADEIINPEYIGWLSDTANQNKDNYVRVPLVNLQGRPDLRVHYPDGTPEPWDRAAYVATKKILTDNKVFDIRIFNTYLIPLYLSLNNNRVEDMGWHFSWMGSDNHRKIKAASWGHAKDRFDHMDPLMSSFGDYEKFISTVKLEDGSKAPDGSIYHILKDYPKDSLPSTIYEIPVIRDFFFGIEQQIPKTEWDQLISLEYEKEINDTTSDIYMHMGDLCELAKDCKHATEMGARYGSSTRALLKSDISLISYDLNIDDTLNKLFEKAKSFGKDVQYVQSNVLEISIKQTDMLFIDTWHTRAQLTSELKLHADKVNKYIAFHDTQTFGTTDEKMELDPNGHFQKPKSSEGILPAIIDFIIHNPEWKFKMHKTVNNGFTVIERINK